MENKVEYHSMDIIEQKKQELMRIFPEIIVEGKLDIDKLKLVLGEDIAESRDKFGLYWNGKSDIVFKNIQTPSKGTLVPCEEESIRFGESENIFIEGENLEVLKLLQKSYFGKVKAIYIDPPYNTGNEFIYPDNYADSLNEYLAITGQVNEKGLKTTSNIEKSGRKHTNWLNMMYPRLYLARNLLREDGVIFVSIDDNEAHHLRDIMDDIFGEENFVGMLIWRKKEGGGQTDAFFVTEHEYIVVYQRSSSFKWLDEQIVDSIDNYKKEDENGRFKTIKLAKWGNAARKEDRPKMHFPITAPDGTEVIPYAPDGNLGRWRVGTKRMNELIENNLIYWEKRDNDWIPYEKVYYSEDSIKLIKERSILYKVANTADAAKNLTEIFGKKDVFPNPKPSDLIKFCLKYTTYSDSIVLDFFAGSGTTAQAVMELNDEDENEGNRKFILVQLPEPLDNPVELDDGAKLYTIADITKERIRRVIGGYGDNPQPLDTGFKVFKLSKSNYKLWEEKEINTYDQQSLFKQMEEMIENPLIEGAKDIDIVYENVLKEGFDLNRPISIFEIAANKFYKVEENTRVMYVCLDKKLYEETIFELTSDKYKENLLVCLDSAVTDSDKQNIAAYMRLKTI